VIQDTGETHRRVAIPPVPGIQRSIAITPCFSKTKTQKIIHWLFKSKSSLFTVSSQHCNSKFSLNCWISDSELVLSRS
jgi:hypothetical protein